MKTKYMNGLNAARDIMIIHLSSIEANIKKMPWEEAKAESTLIKHHIVGTKQGNSRTNVILRITDYLKTKKNIREVKLTGCVILSKTMCLHWRRLFFRGTLGLNAFQTRAMPCMCTLHCYFSNGVSPISVNFTKMEKLHC